MKKSELIKLLVLDLRDSNGMRYEDQARFILARIESVGMLPPAHFGKLPKIEGNDVDLSWEDETND